MSTLWKVKVLELRGAQIRLAVHQAHPDAGSFPLTPQFALRLLFDEARALDERLEEVARGPLGEALTGAEIHDERLMTERAAAFVASVVAEDLRNAPFDEARVQQELESTLSRQGLGRADPRWQDAIEERWRAFWSDPARVPSAVYTITVTDPRWLAHLAPGQSWRSAAFSYDGPFA